MHWTMSDKDATHIWFFQLHKYIFNTKSHIHIFIESNHTPTGGKILKKHSYTHNWSDNYKLLELVIDSSRADPEFLSEFNFNVSSILHGMLKTKI